MAHKRVVQWATMARTWWLFDAKFQCPYRSAEKLCMYLEGRHKPLYHSASDVGDHVVVFNTKHIAMADDLWRTDRYFHHTRYPGGFSVTSAWRLHEVDPTRVMYKAVFYALPKDLGRPTKMMRLHLYPEEEVPDHIMENVSDVIRQIQVVPKRLENYTPEELENFPKLFDWPENHILFKKEPMVEPPKTDPDTKK